MVEVEATKKKRVADRQITKDDGDSEPEDRDPDRAFDPNLTAGVFQKASSEEMSRRRIVRAKRRGAVAPVPEEKLKSLTEEEKSKDPFLSAQKLASEAKEGKGGETSESKGKDADKGGTEKKPAANPFAGISFTSAFGSSPSKKPENPFGAPKREGAGAARGETAAPTATTSTFSKPAASSANPFSGGFKFGSSGGSGGGFGAFSSGGGFGSKGGFGSGGGFGSSTANPFNFAANPKASPTSAADDTAQKDGAGSKAGGAQEKQQVDLSPPKAVAIGQSAGEGTGTGAGGSKFVKETETVTGEEGEESVFSATGVLYEFSCGPGKDESGNPEKSWKEKGRGDVAVNVHKETKKARMIFRTTGTKRLILNANLWPGMAITPMTGNNGVTFAAVNAAAAPSSLPEEEADKEAKSYALRLPKAKVPNFQDVVNKHKKQE